MASYYISNLRGSDSTGVGSASNPWATVSKAIGTSPAITLSGTGDIVYVEPGTYPEVVSVGLSPTLAGPLSVIADSDGAGFLAGGYATPATGVVTLKGWSNNTTPLTANETLIITGKTYITIQGFKIIGSNGGGLAAVSLAGAFSNITLKNCIIIPWVGKGYGITVAPTSAVSLACTFDSCTIISHLYGIDFRVPLNSTEYSLDCVIKNCWFSAGAVAVRIVNVGGSGSACATGVALQNCTSVGGTSLISYAASVTLATPVTVKSCAALFPTSSALLGTNTSQISEDGNFLLAATPRTNVTAGSNSITTGCPDFDLGDDRLMGIGAKMIGTPSVGSIFASFSANYGTAPTTDLFGRDRPEGLGSAFSAAGALELHDTAAVQTGTVQTGSAAQKLGPGKASQEYRVPVAASATPLTIYTNVDANYGTATPPVFRLLAEPAIGVSAASVTAPANTGTWNQLSIPSFTPTAAGWVTVRVEAVPNAATGICYIDTFGGATGDPASMGIAYRGGSVPRFLASLTTNVTNYIFNSEC